MPPDTTTGATTGATRSTSSGDLDAQLAGLDALELVASGPSRGRRLWDATWPKVAAVAISLGLWQLVVASGWRPTYVLPSPVDVFSTFWDMVESGTMLKAAAVTLTRGFVGYAISLVIGVAIGTVVLQSRIMRSAVGSLITGLQTMPSIAWFPLAILLFKLSEQAILFVVVLGAAPAIANGLISGADQVPPVLLRAGRVLGARGLRLFRTVTLPASMPSFVGGLKQGWAFAWRSLMAGELIVIIASRKSLGFELQEARNLADAQALLATMVMILIIGIIVDSLLFGRLERVIKDRWGLGTGSR